MLTRAAGAAGAAAMMGPYVSQAAASPAGGSELLPAWDAHTHLVSGGQATVAQRVANLLKYADRMAIERIVVSLGRDLVDHPTPEELRRQNDDVLEAIACAPQRVMGLVYLNPRYERECLAELDRCVRDGPMVGVKLLTAVRCSRRELDPIVARAGELRVPILQHAFWHAGGNPPDESTPADVAILAARHPQASFICAHSGADWERGFRQIRALKNVWAEISGSDPTAGMVEMAVRELGAARVVYGSDAGGRSFASQLAKVYGADIPLESRRLVLRENLRGLLTPALRAKGVKP